MDWRRDFVKTYLERELPGLDLRLPAATLRRFWAMLAHSHAQAWNSFEFARSFGVSDKTVRRYLDVLSDTFMTRLLRRLLGIGVFHSVDKTQRYILSREVGWPSTISTPASASARGRWASRSSRSWSPCA